MAGSYPEAAEPAILDPPNSGSGVEQWVYTVAGSVGHVDEHSTLDHVGAAIHTSSSRSGRPAPSPRRQSSQSPSESSATSREGVEDSNTDSDITTANPVKPHTMLNPSQFLVVLMVTVLLFWLLGYTFLAISFVTLALLWMLR